MIRVANLSQSAKYFKWRFMPDDFNFEQWYKETFRIYDTDTSGDSVEFWVVVTPDKTNYYRVYHEWWIDYWDTEFSSTIENDYTIIEVDRSTLTELETLKFVI